MKTQKRVKAISFLLSSVILLNTTTYVFAAKSDEILEEIDSMTSQQAALENQVSTAKAQTLVEQEKMQANLAKKSQIDSELAQLRTQIRDLEKEIRVCEEYIAAQEKEVREAQFDHNQLCIKYKDRIRAMEESRGIRYWSVIFKAHSLLDMIDKIEMQKEIAQADEKMMAELKDTSDKLNAEKTKLEEHNSTLLEKQEALKKTEKSLVQKQSEVDAILNEISSNIDAYEALIDQAEEESSALINQIIAAKTEYNKAKEEESAKPPAPTQPAPQPEDNEDSQAQNDTPSEEPDENDNQQENSNGENTESSEPSEEDTEKPPASSESWVCPVDWYVLTSEFGYRVHPIHGTTSFHNGIDMAGNEGMPIYASRSGTVIAAYSDYIGGEMVIIDHGDGVYQSVYMHMINYIVSEGDYVSQGQVIGYMGSTGWSTGDHLHFSILENGTYVDPIGYI